MGNERLGTRTAVTARLGGTDRLSRLVPASDLRGLRTS